MSETSHKLDPKFRRTEFLISPSTPRYWSAGNPSQTHFANALSILLPEYEKLFIVSIASRLKEITDPTLKSQGKTFCAQEGQHASVHRNYNRWLVSIGYTEIPKIESILHSLLSFLEKTLPKSWLLGIVAGGEHVTSFIANDYLSHPEKWMKGSDPTIAALWQWHAAEEIEHKAVCFDAYQSLAGSLWIRRISFLLILSLTLFISTLLQIYLLWKDGRLFRKSTLKEQVELLLGTDGFLVGLVGESMKYLRKDFHPWDTRDAHLVLEWEKRNAVY